MSFTVATVLAFNGERGLAENRYGDVIRFLKEEVYHKDLPMMQEGATILIFGTGHIELASSSFMRFDRNEFVLTNDTITEKI